MTGGGVITPIPPHRSQVVGSALPRSHPQTGSPVLLPPGSALLCFPEPALLSVAASEGQDSSPVFMTCGQPSQLQRWGGAGSGEHHLCPLPSHSRQVRRSPLSHSCLWGQLTHTFTTRASPTVLPGQGAGLALLSAPQPISATSNKGWDQFCKASGRQWDQGYPHVLHP